MIDKPLENVKKSNECTVYSCFVIVQKIGNLQILMMAFFRIKQMRRVSFLRKVTITVYMYYQSEPTATPRLAFVYR